MTHSLLERQIRKHLSSLTPQELEKIQPFIKAVEDGYIGFENDKKLSDRSLEISSEEFRKMNQLLRENAHEKQEVLDNLLETINKLEKLKGMKEGNKSININNVAEYLKDLIDENISNQQQLEILNRAINTSNVTVIVWEKTRKGDKKTIKFVSKNIEKNFGYTYEDFLSGTLQLEDIVFPEDREAYAKNHGENIDALKTIHTEYRIKHKNGNTVWVSEEDVIEIKENGEDLEYEGIIVDVTLLKQKQREVEENEKYLSTILSNIGEGICVIDSQRQIKLLNPTGAGLFGIKSAASIGKKFLETLIFYHIISGESYSNVLSRYFNQGQVETIFDDICIRINEKRIPVSVTISPIKGMVEKTMQGWIVVFRDKTKEKELDDIKNEFLSVASHELRTPMTVVNGYSTLLIEQKIGPINEQQKKYLERIKSNTTQLIDLVNDMLTLSKIEAGKMTMEYTNFDIESVVGDVLSSFALKGEERKIKLYGETQPCFIYSDRRKLEQVMINLVGNAIKFTPENGSISIKLVDNTEDDSITVTVKDTGVGIKEEDIQKLFSKFYQVVQGEGTAQGGTGLGLSICKNIITQLHGKIGVRSEFGKGSEFFFNIPKKQ